MTGNCTTKSVIERTSSCYPLCRGPQSWGAFCVLDSKGRLGTCKVVATRLTAVTSATSQRILRQKKVLKGRNKHRCNVLNSKVIVKSLRLYISSVFPTQPHKSQDMWKIFFFHSGTVPAWFLLVNWSRQGSPVFWPCPKKWKPKMNMLWWAAWTRGASAVSTQEKKTFHGLPASNKNEMANSVKETHSAKLCTYWPVLRWRSSMKTGQSAITALVLVEIL